MPDGSRADVYVHGKLMLVDDVFATIGSTNFAERSFRNQTEMNVSFQDAAEVKALRCDLFAEHLAQDTSALDVERRDGPVRDGRARECCAATGEQR